jgi:hypothetical protein
MELFNFLPSSVLPIDALKAFAAKLLKKLLLENGFDNFWIRLKNWRLKNVDLLNLQLIDALNHCFCIVYHVL